MKYTIRLTLISEGGAEKTFERTIAFERERNSHPPHAPLPIDVDQKRRVLELAIDEAKREALKDYPIDRETGHLDKYQWQPEHQAFYTGPR